VTLLEHLDDIDVCDDPEWTTPCPYQRLVPGFGVGVLLPGASGGALPPRRRVTARGGQHRPLLGCRGDVAGIVGDRSGRACIQTPIKKQAFAFDDGACLDDPSISVLVYQTRLTADGDVQVAA
jgi:nitrite reductase (NADH) small subunit